MLQLLDTFLGSSGAGIIFPAFIGFTKDFPRFPLTMSDETLQIIVNVGHDEDDEVSLEVTSCEFGTLWLYLLPTLPILGEKKSMSSK